MDKFKIVLLSRIGVSQGIISLFYFQKLFIAGLAGVWVIFLGQIAEVPSDFIR